MTPTKKPGTGDQWICITEQNVETCTYTKQDDLIYGPILFTIFVILMFLLWFYHINRP